MGINGLSAIGIMLAFVGIAVAGTYALRTWVFRTAAASLERCFAEAGEQFPQLANLPGLALETMMTLRTPSRRTALTRSHWADTLSSIAWGCTVLATAAPDYEPSDPKLRRWYRGILANAQRHVKADVRANARQFAADPWHGATPPRTATHPDSWLPALQTWPSLPNTAGESDPIVSHRPVPAHIDADAEPVRLEMSREDRAAWWAQRAKAAADETGHPCAVPDDDDAEQPSTDDQPVQTELTAHGAVLGEAVVQRAEQPFVPLSEDAEAHHVEVNSWSSWDSREPIHQAHCSCSYTSPRGSLKRVQSCTNDHLQAFGLPPVVLSGDDIEVPS